jgi:preprotein translocase subunit SecD
LLKVTQLNKELKDTREQLYNAVRKLQVQKISYEEQKRNLQIQYRSEIMSEAEKKTYSLQKMFIKQTE